MKGRGCHTNFNELIPVLDHVFESSHLLLSCLQLLLEFVHVLERGVGGGGAGMGESGGIGAIKAAERLHCQGYEMCTQHNTVCWDSTASHCEGR